MKVIVVTELAPSLHLLSLGGPLAPLTREGLAHLTCVFLIYCHMIYLMDDKLNPHMYADLEKLKFTNGCIVGMPFAR